MASDRGYLEFILEQLAELDEVRARAVFVANAVAALLVVFAAAEIYTLSLHDALPIWGSTFSIIETG